MQRQLPKPITLRLATRALVRMEHATKLGPDTLADALVQLYRAGLLGSSSPT
jgi:hypothetical protein